MYPRAILSTMLCVLQKKSAEAHPDIPAFYDRLVPRLITQTILALITPEEATSKANCRVLADDSVLEVTGRLINLVIRSLSTRDQERVLIDAFHLFISNKPSGLISKNKEQVVEYFRPFGPGIQEEHVPCMTVFTCIVAGVQREVSRVHNHFMFQFLLSLSNRLIYLSTISRGSSQTLDRPLQVFQLPTK